MTDQTDPFRNYTSKIKRVNILLPEFSFFHGPSSKEKTDSRFIGRKKISEQLESWIKDKECSNGSYLITGYRGMGKTSFVGKVLSNIKKGQMLEGKGKKEENKWMIKERYLQGKYVDIIICLLIIFVTCVGVCNPLAFNFVVLLLLLYLVVSGVYYLVCNGGVYNQIGKNNKTKYSLVINLNLGSEIKGERDILSLISMSLFDEIKEYVRKPYLMNVSQKTRRWFAIGSICLLSLFLYKYAISSLLSAYGDFREDVKWRMNVLYDTISFGHDFLKDLFGSPEKLLTLFMFSLSVTVSILLWKCFFVNFIAAVFAFIGFRDIHPNMVLRKLKRLNDRIEAAVNEDDDPNGAVSTSVFSLTFKRRRMRSYQPATVREIEQALINVIRDMTSFADIIIVLDELDKIDASRIGRDDKDQAGVKREEELPEFGYDTSGFPGGASSRSKKRNVLFLLAQMKYFISTAKAKFIFISGRELYDAYLADVSDREFSISSIFNGIIYVDSFLTCEKGHEKDVTLMAEKYLCKLLVSEKDVEEMKDRKLIEHSLDSLTLKQYYLFLLLMNKDNLKEKRNEIEKIMLLLNQFVTYLTYVSNGAPKKITTHLERFITTYSKNDEKAFGEEEESPKEDNSIVFTSKKISDNEKRSYLSFGYKDQQKIGFIHYITFPIFQTIINQASEYSDKLLISSSFLIGHIYKHHANGFSWRNLEYIPELIEMNRTPELRDFINSMITFLKQMYLTPITCGLYHFKFPKRISEEISILSKKYDEISAIFNFSLDDSRSVKKYYSKLLTYYSKDNYSSKHTLANIHVILGDLHLADEEYTEAICEFRNAINLLSSPVENNYAANVKEAHSSIHIMNQIRAMLKLGLAYEKRKTLDSAYLTYSELINKLIDHRYIDEDKLGLQFKVERTNSWFGHKAILYRSDNVYSDGVEWLRDNALYAYDDMGHGISQRGYNRNLHPRSITEDEKEHILYWMYGEEIIPNLSYQLTPEKAGLIAKLTLFEDLRLAYMPSLAKLFSIEKMDMGGITQENLEVAESEFKYLHLTTNVKDKYIISADFSRKLGDILYYKNGMLNCTTNSLYLILQIWGFNIKYDVFDFCLSNKIPMKESKSLINIYDADYKNFTGFIDLLGKPSYSLEDFRGELEKDSIEIYRCKYAQKEKLSVSENDNIVKLVTFISDKLYEILGSGKCNNKIKDCCLRRMDGFKYYTSPDSKNIKRPCFACMYYNRSLKILEKYVVKKDDEKDPKTIFNVSKSLLFLKAIINKNLYVYEKNTLDQMALTLEAMGNITFTCLDDTPLIHATFVESFIELLKTSLSADLEGRIIPKSQLEKSILYFWTAAKYHKKASNFKESHQCYINIIRVFSTYITHADNLDEWVSKKDFVSSFCNAIDQYIVKRAIMRVFSNREFTNMAELQEIKWIFSREMYETIDFNQLSLLPDIEEIIYAFYEMKTFLYKKSDNDEFKKNIRDDVKSFYKSDLLNSLRKDSTIYSRVLALHFKSSLNSFVLSHLQSNYNSKIEKDGLICSHNDVALLIVKILIDGKCFNAVSEEYFNFQPDNRNNVRSKLCMLEFLVEDSMFCLSELLEILVPSSKTSLFTNSFIAGAYKQLYKWNRIYETLFQVYRFLEIKKHQKGDALLNGICFEDSVRDRLNSLFDIEIEKRDAENFFKDLYKRVGKYNMHYTSDNYLAEMAIKRYTKAIEMHTEGQAYKDFIANFYVLNDDLQNNTCQFYFAMERYKINIGKVDGYINMLKTSFKTMPFYQSGKYFKENAPAHYERGSYYVEHLLFDDK